jgi:hypothetical protein
VQKLFYQLTRIVCTSKSLANYSKFLDNEVKLNKNEGLIMFVGKDTYETVDTQLKAAQWTTTLANFLDIKTPDSADGRVHTVATDALIRAQETLSLAQPPLVSLATKDIASEDASRLHAYLTARETLVHNPLAMLLYDVKNHHHLPQQHRHNYRPIGCHLDARHLALRSAEEGPVFTLTQDSLLSHDEALVGDILKIFSTPADPAKIQKIQTIVDSKQAQQVTEDQLEQSLKEVLTATVGFETAVTVFRKANERELKSTSHESEEPLDKVKQKSEKPSESPLPHKAEQKTFPKNAPSLNFEKREAKQLAKQIQQEREEKFHDRKNEIREEILIHEEKLARQRKSDLKKTTKS